MSFEEAALGWRIPAIGAGFWGEIWRGRTCVQPNIASVAQAPVMLDQLDDSS